MKKNQNFPFQPSQLIILLFFLVVVFHEAQSWPSESNMVSQQAPLRVLMVGGGASHDFDQWYRHTDVITLEEEGLAKVKYTDDTDSILYFLDDLDVLFLSNNQPIEDPKTRKAIFNFVENGNGLILAHAGLWYNWEDWPEFNRELVSGGSRGHDKYGEFKVEVVSQDHPVMEDIAPSFNLKDELYYFKPDPKGPGIEVLAMASTEGKEGFPSVFVVKHPKARIVGIALGHDGESHDLKTYHRLLRNAVKWVAKK